jgi:cytochrome c oxidase subunit 3
MLERSNVRDDSLRLDLLVAQGSAEALSGRASARETLTRAGQLALRLGDSAALLQAALALRVEPMLTPDAGDGSSVAGDEWFPFQGHKLPVAVAGVNTAILLSSSVTMHWAETSIKNGNRLGLKAGILSTFLLGCTFLFVQINEYAHIGFAPHDFAQASVFYGLTGLHGAHVFVGLTLLAMVVVRSFRGHYSPEEHRGVEVPGIYWHFVDVMWVVVYSSVYVL